MIGSSGKILVRNLDGAVLQALEAMATASDRSLEAEARHALRSWVRPLLVSEERSERRAQVAQRLDTVLTQINDATRLGWRPSHVAQGIDAPLVEPVEDWFMGRTEPTLHDLEKVADLLGVNRRWLQHGDSQPFPVFSMRLSEDPGEAVRWLLNRPADLKAGIGQVQQSPSNQELKRLILVRSASDEGELAIVKQLDNYRCETFTTSTHISDKIGAGGEAQLMALSLTLQLLYKIYTKPPSPHVTSWILSEKSFSALVGGRAHPRSFDDSSVVRPWWEDFWDESMVAKNNYWKGWIEITSRIRHAIDATDRLAKERDLIRTGEHPMLKI